MSDTGYRLKKTIKALEALDRLRAEWQQMEKNISNTLKSIQADCPHLWECIPDASGNSGDYEKCEICGVTT